MHVERGVDHFHYSQLTFLFGTETLLQLNFSAVRPPTLNTTITTTLLTAYPSTLRPRTTCPQKEFTSRKLKLGPDKPKKRTQVEL
jgi:hypothetical protein